MTAAERAIVFVLHIQPDEYLRHYQGTARHVVARGRDGRTVQFPAALLRRFLVHDGIHGEFRIQFDEHNRLVSLECIGPAR